MLRNDGKGTAHMKKWVRSLSLFATVAVLAEGCGAASTAAPSAATKTTSVTVEIDGAAVPYYAPLYVAEKRGYFKRHGLDVHFIYGDGADIAKNVAVGNVAFGFPNADEVIAAYANGAPLRVVDTTYQHGIGALIFLKGSGIHSAQDLKGKTVAITGYGSPNYIQLQVMLKRAHIPLSDVRIDIIGSGSIVNALTSGQVNAIDFSMLRTYALQAQGVPAEQILSDTFLPDHGNVVVTSAAELKTHPQLVKNFILALHEGISWISAGHELQATKMSLSYAPSFANQVPIVTQILKKVYVNYLWHSPYTQKYGLGYGYLPAWQDTIDILAEYKVIPHTFPAGNLVVQPSTIP